MFINFFYTLRRQGIPVALTEWMALMEALALGLAHASLSSFYYLARAILVKSEAYYDQFDLAFQEYFKGVETPPDILEEALQWVNNPMAPHSLSKEEMERLRRELEKVDLEELRRTLAKRLQEQKEQHHGGSKWIGTGGTSPFGHSGFNPAGIRIGGESFSRSAVKVAAQRRFRDYRTDQTLGVRQFELALRRLRQLTRNSEAPPEDLDLDSTIDATCRNAGNLELVWARPRRNNVKVLLVADVGGSMFPYSQLVSQLFSAAHRASHFKKLKCFYFHNTIYDRLYQDASLDFRRSEKTADILRHCEGDHKLILVGDACMAPTELLARDGIIDWNLSNEEPSLEWLRRLARHFRRNAWINPIPASNWDFVYGNYTLNIVKQVFPMFELTLEGLNQAIKKLVAWR